MHGVSAPRQDCDCADIARMLASPWGRRTPLGPPPRCRAAAVAASVVVSVAASVAMSAAVIAAARAEER